MDLATNLGLWDYIVIGLSLLVSAIIGIYFRFSGGRQKTTNEFLMAGKDMSRFPVVFSIIVTNLSAILMLGGPAEVYKYGTQIMVLVVGMAIGIMLASVVFLPVYMNVGLNSVYEYLDMRFGKRTRTVVSFLFIIQMMLYMSVVLYAPALALNAVTNLSTQTSIVLLGVVCTFYCSMGGLKAVLWTDVFQAILMYSCLMIVFITSLVEAGGLERVSKLAHDGQRMQSFNFSFDFKTRYTFWNSFFRGLSLGFGGYGVSQLEVQRMLSLNNLKKAQSALMWSIGPVIIIVLLCYFLGVILYAVFYMCDPVLRYMDTGITKYDQLVPYYIVTRLSFAPGLTGLCISGIFSGALSTISSAVNSVTTVTVMDFIKPFGTCKRLKESRTVLFAKLLAMAYGGFCIGLAFFMSSFESVLQMATVTLGVVEGPVIALFLLGMTTSRALEEGVLIGFLAGVVLSGWIGFGSSLSSYRYPSLPISADFCPLEYNASSDIVSQLNVTVPCYQNISLSSCTSEVITESDIFPLYTVSYMWIPTLGFICTLVTGYIASIAFGWKKIVNINPKLISPVARYWITNSTFEDSIDMEAVTLSCGTEAKAL